MFAIGTEIEATYQRGDRLGMGVGEFESLSGDWLTMTNARMVIGAQRGLPGRLAIPVRLIVEIEQRLTPPE